MKYYARIDRSGVRTEVQEVSTASASKVLLLLPCISGVTTITVFRKKTWEILSRVKFDSQIGDFYQSGHPKYLED